MSDAAVGADITCPACGMTYPFAAIAAADEPPTAPSSTPPTPTLAPLQPGERQIVITDPGVFGALPGLPPGFGRFRGGFGRFEVPGSPFGGRFGPGFP